MVEHKKEKSFKKNAVIALLAQTVSLGVSFIMSMVIPRYMDVASYGYWQLFIFYTPYSVITHLGIVDGIYLRELGKRYENLNFPSLGMQFRFLTVEQAVIAVGMILGAKYLVQGDRQFVFVMTGIYMVLFNLIYYIGYIFQATNHTYLFSNTIIIEKLLFIMMLVVLVMKREDDYRVYILAYTVSKFISLIYCIYNGREIVFAACCPMRKAAGEIGENIKVGLNLGIGNLAGQMILGCGRIIVDWKWGIEKFSIFSYAITMTNFFLVFINQISMVLLPELKRADNAKQKQNFVMFRERLPILMMGMLVFYAPVKVIMEMWLPKYSDSFFYMALLLPVIVFDGKMQLINNVYLKMLRKEKMILRINVIAVAASAVSSITIALLFENVTFIMAALVIIVGIRSLYAEYFLQKIMEIPASVISVWEIVLTLIFVSANMCFSVKAAFGIYLAAYVFFLFITKTVRHF